MAGTASSSSTSLLVKREPGNASRRMKASASGCVAIALPSLSA